MAFTTFEFEELRLGNLFAEGEAEIEFDRDQLSVDSIWIGRLTDDEGEEVAGPVDHEAAMRVLAAERQSSIHDVVDDARDEARAWGPRR